MTLVFAIMHLYNIFKFFIASVHSFFYTFLKSYIDKSTEWSMIPACPSLMCFLTGVILKGQILRKFCVDVCVCFVLCKFVSGLILWFMDNLWFVDLCAE